MERWSLALVATYAAIIPLVLITGMDAGVVFCRRSDFLEIGGYNERLLVAEDVAFLWALKRLGRSRRQRLIRLRSIKAVASTRKFDRHGDWHYFRDFTRMALGRLRNPNATDEFIQRYWYNDR